MATESYSKPPVLIRADLTPDQWTRLRQLALTERRPVKALVGDALRATYNLNGDPKP